MPRQSNNRNFNIQKKFYKTNEFNDLSKEWNAKLKASGFNDLEEGENEYTKLPISVNTRASRFKSRTETERYFEIASDYLRNGKFNTPNERMIWELHCQGDSLVEI